MAKITNLRKTPFQIQNLYSRGVKSVIPLFKGKSPGFSEWQKISDEEAQSKIWNWGGGGEDKEEVCNYGIRLGRSFGDICDVDLDSKESRLLAKHYLPTTSTFGRGGNTTHYLYHAPGVKATRRLCWDKRDEKSVLLELRASGQTMAPGSIHPETKEPIEWTSDEPLITLEGDKLVQCTMRLAAASLLYRDWQSGGRDELAVCLVGSMVRAQWEDHDIDSFLEPILIESGDEESVKRLKSERLRDQLENGGRVPGLKRLRELCTGGGLGQQGFERIVEWLELGGGDILEEINSEYAVVSLPMGGVSIMREGSDGVSFLDRASFSLVYANRNVDHQGRSLTADKFWLAHKERREYLKGVVFRPGGESKPGEYNLWRGFSVEPTEGKWGCGWEHLLGHIQNSLCAGEERLWKWFIGWMAHRVQRPWEIPQSAIVLIGERGDGKSSIFKLLGALFGKHYMAVTNPDHLLGKFNKHLMDKVLVLADEAIWGGDKTNEGILKVMISEDKRVLEIKGKDSFEVDNCTAYGICSNNDWVVPVGRHERRFLILRGDGVRRGQLEFWDALYDQMERQGGLSRMLYDLQHWDLTGWRGNRPPATEELRAQSLRGVEHWCQWAHAEMIGGGWVQDRAVDIWQDDLYMHYSAWMDRHRFRPDPEAVWVKNLHRMFGDTVERVRRRVEVRRFSGRAGDAVEFKKKWKLSFKVGWSERMMAFLGNDME